MGTHPPGNTYESAEGIQGLLPERPCWPVVGSMLCVIANPETLATSGSRVLLVNEEDVKVI